MTKSRILVAEDDGDIRDLITLHLSREGHTVEECADGDTAMEKIRSGDYRLLILDWMLPGKSGLDIIRETRKIPVHEDTGILMVTAKSANSDLILGLESGADDYLIKPFEVSVLMARARAVLRRSDKRDAGKKHALGSLEIDEASHEARCSGEALQLTPYEFKLLLTLVRNKGRVLTRDKLIQEVQGEGVAVVERAIDTHVFGLRKKLGPCSELLETVRGVGYRVSTRP